MTATNHDNQLGQIYPTMLNVHLALVVRVFITVAVMIMACGRLGHMLET